MQLKNILIIVVSDKSHAVESINDSIKNENILTDFFICFDKMNHLNNIFI
jgi:hypothetical protein